MRLLYGSQNCGFFPHSPLPSDGRLRRQRGRTLPLEIAAAKAIATRTLRRIRPSRDTRLCPKIISFRCTDCQLLAGRNFTRHSNSCTHHSFRCIAIAAGVYHDDELAMEVEVNVKMEAAPTSDSK